MSGILTFIDMRRQARICMPCDGVSRVTIKMQSCGPWIALFSDALWRKMRLTCTLRVPISWKYLFFYAPNDSLWITALFLIHLIGIANYLNANSAIIALPFINESHLCCLFSPLSLIIARIFLRTLIPLWNKYLKTKKSSQGAADYHDNDFFSPPFHPKKSPSRRNPSI